MQTKCIQPNSNLPYCIPGPHSDPLRDRPILFQLLGQLSLDDEGLVSGLKSKIITCPRLREQTVHKLLKITDRWLR